MSATRRLMLHARLVLAAFVLSLGVAIAAPVLRPAAYEMICAGGVMKLVERTSPGASESARSGQQPGALADSGGLLGCPLCAAAGLPPAAVPAPPLAAYSLAAPESAPPAPARVRADAPAPARGPPALVFRLS